MSLHKSLVFWRVSAGYWSLALVLDLLIRDWGSVPGNLGALGASLVCCELIAEARREVSA